MSGFGEFIGACIAWWFTSYNIHLTAPDESLGKFVLLTAQLSSPVK